jgi:hypothetical protein
MTFSTHQPKAWSRANPSWAWFLCYAGHNILGLDYVQIPSRYGSGKLQDPVLLSLVMRRVQVDIGPVSCQTQCSWNQLYAKPNWTGSSKLLDSSHLGLAACQAT